MKIKVCGLKFPENINQLSSLPIDYMGFICYNLSSRFISGLQPYDLSLLPKNIIKTGVFVNETVGNVKDYINNFGFRAIQLHGNESPEFCAVFFGNVKVIKAFGIDEYFDFDRIKAYVDVVDFFLFDTKTSVHGGSGKKFDWRILHNYRLNKPFFLSGGLSIDNLHEIEITDHPALYGIDLNSRFEDEPGLKNVSLLKQALNILKKPVAHEVRS